MTLKVLSIENLRNLTNLRVSLHPRLNVISGHNGTGKTSFLEAIYLLSCGKSFRARETSALVTHDQSQLTLHAKLIDDRSIALQKSLTEVNVMRVNDVPCSSVADFARVLPAQVFYQDIFQIIDAGPAVRRSVLDWGLFHVKHQYYEYWKNYRRVLKQRNSLLRQRARPVAFIPWDQQLSDLAHEMDQLRYAYLVELKERFYETLPRLTTLSCSLDYFKGWDRRQENKSLKIILEESLPGDLQYQYTRYGAHQAELLFLSGEHKSKHFLSRGQQKIILFALKIAQSQLLDRECLFLMDDLFAEFDEKHSVQLVSYLLETPGQFFVTCHDGLPHFINCAPDQYQLIDLSCI